jgi:hypothetical protein
MMSDDVGIHLSDSDLEAIEAALRTGPRGQSLETAAVAHVEDPRWAHLVRCRRCRLLLAVRPEEVAEDVAALMRRHVEAAQLPLSAEDAALEALAARGRERFRARHPQHPISAALAAYASHSATPRRAGPGGDSRGRAPGGLRLLRGAPAFGALAAAALVIAVTWRVGVWRKPTTASEAPAGAAGPSSAAAAGAPVTGAHTATPAETLPPSPLTSPSVRAESSAVASEEGELRRGEDVTAALRSVIIVYEAALSGEAAGSGVVLPPEALPVATLRRAIGGPVGPIDLSLDGASVVERRDHSASARVRVLVRDVPEGHATARDYRFLFRRTPARGWVLTNVEPDTATATSR